MQTRTWQTGIARPIRLRRRLDNVCTSYLLCLRVVTTKHALANAARFAARHPSQCSKMVPHHGHVAVSTLESLSKTHAKPRATGLNALPGRPWKSAISIASPRPRRASLPPAHAQTCTPGNGFGLGPQGTHRVLLLHDRLIPLRPLPFYSQT